MSAALADNYQLSFVLCLAFIFLVPFAIAGLALINTGLGRSRSAAHAMTMTVSVLSVALFVYFVWGLAVQEFDNISFHSGPFVLARSGLFFRGISWGSLSTLAVVMGLLRVAVASLIPLGSAADRCRLTAANVSTILFAGVVYPLFACFASTLLLSFRLPGFLDAGGSGGINATGGLTGLAVAWLLGPRHGKYSAKGMPTAIPAHNQVFVLFGCLLAWIGWLGLNAAGAMLYAGMPPEQSVLVAINTTFSSAAAGLTAATVTRIRFRRPDASLIANGWMAGLVASSAGCASLKPATAVITGLVAGALVVSSVEFFEFWLRVDDPCGSISVHGVCGIWGLLAAGIFAGGPGQFMAQLAGVATLLGLVFPMTYGLNWLVNKFIPYRVSLDGERQGLDLHELGADAYPEFVVHADEFMQR
jgi:Amt family ammonium transporter